MRAVCCKVVPVLAVVLAVSGCKAAGRATDVGGATATTPAGGVAPGPVGTVKQVMKGMVDPTSALIWNAVSTESTDKGLIEKVPHTDDDWAKIENGALTLAEAERDLSSRAFSAAAFCCTILQLPSKTAPCSMTSEGV